MIRGGPQVIDLVDRDNLTEWDVKTTVGFPDSDGISRHLYDSLATTAPID